MSTGKRKAFLGFIGVIFLCFFFVRFFSANAGDICYPARSVNQWSCIDGSSPTCEDGWTYYRCSGDFARICATNSDCSAYGSGTCVELCGQWVSGSTCAVTSGLVPCTGEPSCRIVGNIYTCNDGQSDDVPRTCTLNLSDTNFECWGPGPDTPTPTQPGDPTPDPSDPTPTQIPTPTCNPACVNDGICGFCEDLSCPDCLPPSEPSDITVAVVQVNSLDCSMGGPIVNSTDYVTSGSVTLSGGSPAKPLNGSPLTWLNLPSSTYVATVVPPVNTTIIQNCLYNLDNIPPTFVGYQSSINTGVLGDNFYLYVAVDAPGTWSQSGGGDVYAQLDITSLVPVTGPKSYFSQNGQGGFPGLVSFGGTLDASFDAGNNGADVVGGNLSTTRWNANITNPTQSLYEHFTTLLGGMTGVTADPLSTPGELVEADFNNCSSDNFCYFDGDVVITSGNPILISGAEKSRIIVINGILTVQDTVKTDAGKFLAFIVKNGITIGSGVGSGPIVYTNSPANPQVQGVYITDGAFSIPSSGSPPDSQLILKGTFIASNFFISRSLTDVQNALFPATMFVFDPSLLFSMPLLLQETPFRWQEVAP